MSILHIFFFIYKYIHKKATKSAVHFILILKKNKYNTDIYKDYYAMHISYILYF